MKKIELDYFDNHWGMKLGLAIVKLAQDRTQKVAVQVERINHPNFLYVEEGLSADKHDWIRRKVNVVKKFEESSLTVKKDLNSNNMTLSGTFGLQNKNFLAKGGSIPIFVKKAGMVAIVTVSGLHDEEDHQIIVEALQESFRD